MKWMLLNRLLVTALIVSVGWIPELVGKQVQLEVSMPNPVLLANKKQTTYLKVGMTGFRQENEKSRPPVNVAIVLDRSGSMSGEKLDRAKDAAKEAINRLDSQDILSLVVYDSVVNVICPGKSGHGILLKRESKDEAKAI